MPCAPSGSGGPAGGGSGPPSAVASASDSGGTATEDSSPTTLSSSHNVESPTTTNNNNNNDCPPEVASPGSAPAPTRPGGANPIHTRPPPPPPPRPSHCIHGRPLSSSTNRGEEANGANQQSNARDASRPCWKSWNKKYVLLCGTCGMSSVLLGTFYLAIYFVLRSYTSSLEFFQTMPTYIPACALIVTGLSVLAFMSRRNRITYLIKAVGCSCLVCAVVCVIVTVTTTVLHMNRLQTLRECTFYTQLHSCTCLPFTDEEPFELKLDEAINNCDVIHGPLYSCLRAMFGVSVIGILVSIFSCMLVYQLSSHEKKKMYWEQLENRRRLLYRRAPASANNCSCCDEYGFASSSELYNYPWGIWDPAEERFWAGGAQLYSPNGEDSSNASRSVLIGGSNPSGGPSLWLPWGGAWGAAPGNQLHASGQQREASTPLESASAGDHEPNQSEDSRPQTTGVLLRPFIPRGLEARFGLRRQPPSGSHSRRPLSDPGVALQLPRYPPPFSEAYLPPLAFQGIEAFPRFMWDPPPPYSQPTSSENIAHVGSPARHGGVSSPPPPSNRALPGLTSPSHHGATLADMMREPGSPVNGVLHSPITNSSGSPSRLQKVEPLNGIGITGSLPVNHRVRRLPLSHVKSLGDVTEGKRVDSLEVLFCDGKDIAALDRFPSQGDVAPHRVFAMKNRHLKSMSDPKSVYISGKMEQESELYFADVSSCVSLHHDGEDGMYYSEPTSSGSQKTPSPQNAKVPEANHLYEQVRDIDEEEEEEEGSHHTSDDTMIVHTSSSDHSLGLDMDNTYSVVSPLTDHSSTSPMATDTDAYSCYNSVASPGSPHSKDSLQSPANLNLETSHLHHHHLQIMHPHHHGYQMNNHMQRNNLAAPMLNDNERIEDSAIDQESEPRYEIIPGEESRAPLPQQSAKTSQGAFVLGRHSHVSQRNTSDLNGNVAVPPTSPTSPSSRFTPISQSKALQRAGLCLPLRRTHPHNAESQFRVPEASDNKVQKQEASANPANLCRYPESEESRKMPYIPRTMPYHNSQPNSPERRLHTVQDLLYPLKSVNV